MELLYYSFSNFRQARMQVDFEWDETFQLGDRQTKDGDKRHSFIQRKVIECMSAVNAHASSWITIEQGANDASPVLA